MSRAVEIKNYLNEKRELIERALRNYMVPATPVFEDHLQAMRYSLYAGGKRIRPILCLAAAEAVSDEPELQERLLPVACSLECIHTYSLIHDDLPAMDNDDLRRGKPTNHKVFGEAAAILAGDSLLTWAFDLLSNARWNGLPAEQQLKIIGNIARAAGPLGMVGGQALDIAHEHKEFPFSMLQTIHRNKTGALITCAVRTGAIGGGASEEQLQRLTVYGEKIGLAFQIVDDLLNATATTEQLGKAAGSDKLRGKATYPAYFGLDDTRTKAQTAISEAISALTGFDNKADPLRALAEYMRTRSY
jgi:geranylgeranyl diphosphate synthase type II